MTSSDKSFSVFLCHASQDKTDVRRLYSKLKAAGLNPWLDEEDLLPGQDWEAAIRRAVRQADAVIVCISHASSTKVGFVQREIRFALDLADERPQGVSFLFPAALDDSPIPDRFAHIQVANLTSSGGYERLLTALRIHASALGKAIPTTIQVGSSSSRERLVTQAYRSSFEECFRSRTGYRHRIPHCFTVSLLGHDGAGRTSLAVVLTQAGFNFLNNENDQESAYNYRLALGKGIFLVDHKAPGRGASTWRAVETYLQRETDIALCVNDASAAGDIFESQSLTHRPALIVPVLTKIDLLDNEALGRRIDEVSKYYGETPLLLSAPTGQGFEDLKRWIFDGRRFFD